MEDALTRAFAFVKAGADGIMIHSRKKDPSEILEFCDEFRKKDANTPIVVVPSSYNVITEEELAAHWRKHSYICQPAHKKRISCYETDSRGYSPLSQG